MRYTERRGSSGRLFDYQKNENFSTVLTTWGDDQAPSTTKFLYLGTKENGENDSIVKKTNRSNVKEASIKTSNYISQAL